ncbi:hypothetical protein [Rhizobium sp. CF080]|uniref:hypothetical protein n=1 Tax=Rhizobium sp. (strain CF080) TaxID=1144310 RepID=UPI0002716F68|nr:hypothetical protein [Rhizobium sp. CF080]
MSIEAIIPRKILVFLPQEVAHVLVAKLAERGYVSAAVSTVPEVFDALRSDCYAFVVTTRLHIALLRNIRSIPVVNLEVFFHATPSGGGFLSTPKKFDSRAFMERIDFLARPVSARRDQVGVEPVRTVSLRGDDRLFRWWARAKNMMGLSRDRGGLKDVQS